jgi:hypothetical protein
LDFVKRFSQINLTNNQMITFPGPKGGVGNLEKFGRYYGNSRDDPTAFLFKCSNWALGCTYTNGNRTIVSHHEISCSVEKIDALDPQRRMKKAFACDEPRCESSFDSQRLLKSHVERVHNDWQPRSCGREGCDQKIIYQTKASLKRHRKIVHTSYRPTACPVPGCSSKTVFKSHDGLEQHVRLAHRLLGEAKAQYVGLTRPKLGSPHLSAPWMPLFYYPS